MDAEVFSMAGPVYLMAINCDLSNVCEVFIVEEYGNRFFGVYFKAPFFKL